MELSRENDLKKKYETLSLLLTEQGKRIWAGLEAKECGRGGVSLLSKVTGLSRTTIYRGMNESADNITKGRIREVGGGRKSILEKHPEILNELELLVDSSSRGDPESPLRWTLKSMRRLQEELGKRGYTISHEKVSDLLKELGYSLQSNRKTLEGAGHEDRDAQFHHINHCVRNYQKCGLPVISVDTKKKELVGEYANKGREWRKKREPALVKTHDFPEKGKGKVNPYGVYDITANAGWVSVGTDHDTARFAVESIRRWWENMGKTSYPAAGKLLITADGGGSNGSRVRLWKKSLQEFVNETGLQVEVTHFPPGTSKWNKIEHKMFSFISMNWRGKPLISHEVIVNLISSTTNSKGLKIKAGLDKSVYETKIKVSDEEMKKINIKKNDFHGEWNYTIQPNCSS